MPGKGPTWEQYFTRESYMGVGGRGTKDPVQQPAAKDNKKEKSSSTVSNIRAKFSSSISVEFMMYVYIPWQKRQSNPRGQRFTSVIAGR